MTDKVKNMLINGGIWSKKDLPLIESELPEEIYTEYGEDFGHLAHRLCHRFYIHELRGYCVIKEEYVIYENHYIDPNIKQIEKFIACKDRAEAWVCRFYDLTMEHSFDSYYDLKQYVRSQGGTEYFDLRNDLAVKNALEDEFGFASDIYTVLFKHRNYIKKDSVRDCYVAVVWLNDYEYCCLDAWYYCDELNRMHAVCSYENDIRCFSHGVQTLTIAAGKPLSADKDFGEFENCEDMPEELPEFW